jgi:hypothetical protein
MPSDPNPWLHAQTLDGPRQLLAVGIADALRLEGAAPMYLAGPDGSGKTRTAGAVAATLGWPTVGVPAQACRQGDDLLLCLGQALGARPIGDEKAVAERLRDRGRVLLVLDDADHPSLAEVVERLRGSASAARWLLTGAPRATAAPTTTCSSPSPADPATRWQTSSPATCRARTPTTPGLGSMR